MRRHRHEPSRVKHPTATSLLELVRVTGSRRDGGGPLGGPRDKEGGDGAAVDAMR